MCHFLAMQECLPSLKRARAKNENNSDSKSKRWRWETTTSVNLAASLAQMGKRVLLVDMDPQGNATMSSGIEKNSVEFSILDLLLEEGDLNVRLLANGWF